jgi:hypothetical protein
VYGVTHELPLQAFVGQEFNYIGLGRFQIQFVASGAGKLFVEGRWELRTPDGAIVDRAQAHEERSSFQIHAIIDVPIRSFLIAPPSSFSFQFESGHELTVYDDPKFESFSIHLDGQEPWYV